MDIVLGVSISPAVVHLVLVEGVDASGATIDHDALDPSADMVSAVLGTQALASAGGHRLTSVGITSTGGTDALADELAAALTSLGFTNVRVVPDQQATEALARSLNAAADVESTAVLSIEPESATLAIVESSGGDVVKTVTRTLGGIDPGDGVTKLAAALDDPSTRTGDLFVVSAGVDVDDVKSYLDASLPMAVHAPAEPELALARGAALSAAAQQPADDDETAAPTPSLFVPRAVRTTAAARSAVAVVEEPAPLRPLDRLMRVRTLSSVLGASAVTFVVASAIAIGMNSGDSPAAPSADRQPLPAAKVQQEVAPAAEQVPLIPEQQPAPIVVAPPVQAPVAGGPPLPPQVIAAINRLQQPVTLPPVPGVSDQPITVPPLPSLIQQFGPH